MSFSSDIPVSPVITCGDTTRLEGMAEFEEIVAESTSKNDEIQTKNTRYIPVICAMNRDGVVDFEDEW